LKEPIKDEKIPKNNNNKIIYEIKKKAPSCLFNQQPEN
jgi:hypothetical protein